MEAFFVFTRANSWKFSFITLNGALDFAVFVHDFCAFVVNLPKIRLFGGAIIKTN